MDLAAALSLVRRRWIPVALCFLTGLIGAFAVSSTTPSTYHASARLFVNIPAARGVQEALQGVQLTGQLMKSYAEIATSRLAADRISERLDGRVTPGDVRARLRARPASDTLLLDLQAFDADPTTARDLANAGAEVLTELIDELEPSQEAPVDARIIDRAVTPRSPVAPKPRNDATLGAILGLAAGLVVAFALEALDKTITTSQHAKDATGAPVLVTVPRHRRLDDEPLIALEGSTSPGGESYRALRTSVQFLDTEATVRTLLVTSPSAGEGKSTTVANLAIAMAQAGERVLIIDGDLRKSRLPELFSVQDAPGLSEVVLGRADLGDAIRRWHGVLDVLPPGALPPNPSELLGSQRMADLLDKLGRQYDSVVIDAPPVLPVTDAAVLAALVDAVMLVVSWAKTEVVAAEEAAYSLERVGGRLVGVVLNASRTGRAKAYYQTYGPRVRSARAAATS